MTDAIISSALLASHFILFSVKLWAVIISIENRKKYALVGIVATLYLLIQVWFIYCFFLDIDLYYYEIVSIIDQCVLTILLIFYLTKEESWQKEEVTEVELDLKNDL